MQKQPILATMPSSSKPSKSAAKSALRQCLTKLNSLHTGSSVSSSHAHNSNSHLYRETISLTSQILLSLLSCSNKSIIDISDVIMQSFVVAFKKMFIRRRWSLALSMLPVDTSLKDSLELRALLASYIDSQRRKICLRMIPTELQLAINNVKSLILANNLPSILVSHSGSKTQTMVQTALICLSKSIPPISPSISLSLPSTLQQQFYHMGLKSAKISKLSNHKTIYKQLLCHYFQYVSDNAILPTLDICRLLNDALQQESGGDCDIYYTVSSASKSVSKMSDNRDHKNKEEERKKDEELIGILIRKCFYLISEHHNKQNFYIEDHIFKETVSICLDLRPFCEDSKTVQHIFQCLFQSNKLGLVVHKQEWRKYCFDKQDCVKTKSNLAQIGKKQKLDNKLDGKSCVKIGKYFSSCFLYISQICSEYFKHTEDNHNSLQQFTKSFINNFSLITNNNKPQLMAPISILNGIITECQKLKIQLIALCSKRTQSQNQSQYRNYKIIDRWIGLVEIQQCIVENEVYQKVSGNVLTGYQESNLYLLAIHQYNSVAVKPSIIANWSYSSKRRQSSGGVGIDIGEITAKIDETCTINMYKYWNDLIDLGASLMDNCGDVQSLNHIVLVLRQLLKCHNMVLIAHQLTPKSQSSAISISWSTGSSTRISGLYNLLVILHRADQTGLEKYNRKQKFYSYHTICATNNGGPGHADVGSNQNYDKSNNKSSNMRLGLTRSMSQVVKGGKNRARAELVFAIFKEFVRFVIMQVLPQLKTPSQTQTDHPYEQIVAYALSLIPKVQAELTFEQKVLICKNREQFIKRVHIQAINKCRYVYHRTVSNLLIEYYNNTLSASSGSLDITQAQTENQALKLLIVSYLQHYSGLYASTLHHSSYSTRTSLDGRRSSAASQSHTYTKAQNMERLIYIDFMQWVLMFCRKRQIPTFTDTVHQLIDAWLDGVPLQAYLQQIAKDLESRKSTDLQLMAECTSKLLYLKSCPKQTNTATATQHEQAISGTTEQNQQSSGQNESARMNIQFELQQSVLTLTHLNPIVVGFGKMCHRLLLDSIKYKQAQLDHHVEYAINKIWTFNHDILLQYHKGTLLKVLNYSRLVVSLNNILSCSHNLGYNCKHQLMKSICAVRLLFSLVMETKWEFYLRGAEMMKFGYLARDKNKIQLITNDIQEFERINRKEESNHALYQDSSSLRSSGSTSASVLNIVQLIKLYLGLKQHDVDIPSIIWNQPLLKVLQTLNMLTHLHPHKPLLRSVSGYIFSSRHLTESSLLQYKSSSMLPTTWSVQQFKTNPKHNHDTKLKEYIQQSSNQLEHYLLATVLQRLHVCIMLNGQISQFRSVLRLALIYFIRSINVRGIMLALTCYQLRTKHLINSAGSSTGQGQIRKSQLIPVGATSSQQHMNSGQYLPPLDMVSLSDSFCTLLCSLKNSQGSKPEQRMQSFNVGSYEKYCKLVIRNGHNRRRTSLSMHTSFQNLVDMLRKSVESCGQIGASVFVILAQHLNVSMGANKQAYVYQQYLSIKYSQQHDGNDTNIRHFHQLHDIDLKQALDMKFHHIKSTQSQPALLAQLKKTIPYSFYHAQLIQNLISLSIRHNQQQQQQKQQQHQQQQCRRGMDLSEHQILELVAMMLDHNWMYKGMVEKVEPICVAGFGKSVELRQAISKSNQTYHAYVGNYHNNLLNKLSTISQHHRHAHHSQYSSHRSQAPATSILYPLHPHLLLLCLSDPLLVTVQDLDQFQQHVCSVDRLIANNSRILYDKNIEPKEWWKGRDRVDRTIGRIVTSVGLWQWDASMTEPKQEDGQTRKIDKLVSMASRYTKDINKIKQMVMSTAIQQNAYGVQQSIHRHTSSSYNNTSANKQTNSSSCLQFTNLLLLVHPSYQIFPFECLPSLSNFYNVYRLPSLQYLCDKLSISNSSRDSQSSGLSEQEDELGEDFDAGKIQYLVNPSHDLVDTEKQFYKIKEHYPLWKGVVGRKPCIKEMLSLFGHQGKLSHPQVYLYMGHGNGVGHLKEREFYAKKIRGVMMLFGCSSVAMTLGKCQANGPSHSHLLNGAAAVLGCLWDVTDKDTDKVTESIFKSITYAGHNLSRLLQNSRKKCKHQYLNGGALVVFGMPVYLYNH